MCRSMLKHTIMPYLFKDYIVGIGTEYTNTLINVIRKSVRRKWTTQKLHEDHWIFLKGKY